MATSRRSPVALAGALLIGLTTLPGCTGPADATAAFPAAAQPTMAQVPASASPAGYPLDRSLKRLSEWPDTDAVVVLDDAQYLTPVQADLPNSTLPDVVIPVQGIVRESLLGDAEVGDMLHFATAGGKHDGRSSATGHEVTPDAGALLAADQVLVAGALVDDPDLGSILEPAFIYSLEGDTLTSLLESAGADAYPSFTLPELRAALYD